MNLSLLALQLMFAQGLLGAFDTLYHHELTQALPQRPSAQRELAIHSLRSLLYCLLFVGLSFWQWQGVWALVLLLVFAVELVLTLWDFVIEDQTRLLPATERVTHTILAINAGAFIGLLVLNTPYCWALPTALAWQPQGWLSWALAICGVGVGLSGLRDGWAACSLAKTQHKQASLPPIHFSPSCENVLVTGGTGFIGQLLVRALLADGQRVTLLSRNPKAAAWLFNGQVSCIKSLAQLTPQQPIDVVINLAGARILGWRWSKARQAVLRASRVATTEALVAWIQRAEVKPRLLLNASAIGYYGIQAAGDQSELDETSPCQSIFMSQLCQDWEAAAEAASQQGVPVVRMRFGLVLGQQGALPMMLLPIKLGLGGALGRGSQWLSWIHVQDLLSAIAHLWQQQASGVVNFTAPEVVTQKQFSQTAAKLLHRPCMLPTPAWPMRWMLGEQADLLLEGQRVVPRRLLATGFQFRYPNLHSALADLV